MLTDPPRGTRDRRAWPRSAPPVRAVDQAHTSDSGSRGVVLLLALAAVVAGIVAGRASLLGSDAASAWQRSVGQEQRRGAFALEGARSTYGSEGDLAFLIAMSEVRAQEQRAEAARQPGAIASRLLAEADVQDQVVEVTRSASEIASDPRYALPGGGYDLQLRLADSRLDLGDERAIEPLDAVAEGDRASDRAVRLTSTTLPVALAFLFGALAQATRRPRTLLLALGWIALLVGSLLAIAVELVG